MINKKITEWIKKIIEPVLQKQDECQNKQTEMVEMQKEIIKWIEEYKLEYKHAALYAYRYLLNREPEDLNIVKNNMKDWKELRADILDSEEYSVNMESINSRRRFQYDVYTTHKLLSQQIEIYGIPYYEDILEESYRKLIKNNDKIVDIGAHVGRHLNVFLELTGGGIFAFEPLPKQYEQLKENITAQNVRIINKALSNESGVANFYEVENFPEESGLKKRIYNSSDAKVHTIQVDVETLDAFKNDLKGVSYIKLDAEGAELNILKGGKQIVMENRPYISIEYGYPSYSVYGFSKNDLWDYAKNINYCITDIYGNLIPNVDTWERFCDSIYWDYFLVPLEKLERFYLDIHK